MDTSNEDRRGPVRIVIVDNIDETAISYAAMAAAAPPVEGIRPAVQSKEQHVDRRSNVASNNAAVIVDGERLIDLPTILRRVPVARSTLFARIRDGLFPRGTKFGRRRLWREAEVDAFVRDL